VQHPLVADFATFGLDPTWSRIIDVPSHDGASHRWHLLDRPGTKQDAPVVLCLHGNPTWSFLWSRLLNELNSDFRVIAPDHLSMGLSEQVPSRKYSDRVADVNDLVTALNITSPIWIVAQDWGGAIAMGYAVAHPDRVAGLVLSNTGIAIPHNRRAPLLIRLSAASGIHRLVTKGSSLFVRGTPFLPGRGISPLQRTALAFPYRKRSRRNGVADFVADAPLTARHSSAQDIADVAEKISGLKIPVRLVWGSRDPVFNDDFAHDLMNRFQNVALHRIADSGHLTVLETSIAPFVEAAINEGGEGKPLEQLLRNDATEATLWSHIDQWVNVDDIAITDAAADASVTRPEFSALVATYAEALHHRGVRLGDRIAVLVPPSIDLIAVVYACWRIGAVAVIADRGLGLRGLKSAIRASRVKHVIGPMKAITAARLLRWAPNASLIRLSALTRSPRVAKLELVSAPEPGADDPAAVLFTSGATGPAKGVRYTHRQLYAQRDALQKTYNIIPTDTFVAAFAPFALYGPALGIATGLADMDVTSPGTLTAAALDDACRRVGATMVFASPAALANVVRTASADVVHLGKVRLVMSAGAPVPIKTLQEISRLCPEAELHTPYGMTEVLPVADVSLTDLVRIGTGQGVCVGKPVSGCDVRIDPQTSELLVSAPWMSAGYDSLWLTQHNARPVVNTDGHSVTWHRTGDVGNLDTEGNVWVEGRLVHVIYTSRGPVAPVPLEIAIEAFPNVVRVAAVGVGPVDVEQIVIVIETIDSSDGPADAELSHAVRAALAPLTIASVWTTKKLPVDIRHNSKIDRTAVSKQMSQILAGAKK
jgi:acyl-coenzyme A synthetase/AMP-(fatty) acid ligase/alpha-beta hydrolase superfamily lysophospholipase